MKENQILDNLEEFIRKNFNINIPDNQNKKDKKEEPKYLYKEKLFLKIEESIRKTNERLENLFIFIDEDIRPLYKLAFTIAFFINVFLLVFFILFIFIIFFIVFA